LICLKQHPKRSVRSSEDRSRCNSAARAAYCREEQGWPVCPTCLIARRFEPRGSASQEPHADDRENQVFDRGLSRRDDRGQHALALQARACRFSICGGEALYAQAIVQQSGKEPRSCIRQSTSRRHSKADHKACRSPRFHEPRSGLQCQTLRVGSAPARLPTMKGEQSFDHPRARSNEEKCCRNPWSVSCASNQHAGVLQRVRGPGGLPSSDMSTANAGVCGT